MSELKKSLIFIEEVISIENLEKILVEYLTLNNLKLCSMKFITEYNMKILQILIDKIDETFVDTTDLEKTNAFVSEQLDRLNMFDFKYMLEVSSVGAEKEIHLENITKHLNEYVTINNELEGYILSVDEKEIVLKQNIRGRIKHVSIPLNIVKKIKLTIKF